MTPEELAKRIESLRIEATFNEDGPTLGPMSEQFYLAAIASLDIAQRNMQIAQYHLMRKD